MSPDYLNCTNADMTLREQYECIYSRSVEEDLVRGEQGTLWFSHGPTRQLSVGELLRSVQPNPERKCDDFVGYSLGPLVDPLSSELLATAKQIFSKMGGNYWAIRGKTNPYECLGKGPRRLFINRSATKLGSLIC